MTLWSTCSMDLVNVNSQHLLKDDHQPSAWQQMSSLLINAFDVQYARLHLACAPSTLRIAVRRCLLIFALQRLPYVGGLHRGVSVLSREPVTSAITMMKVVHFRITYLLPYSIITCKPIPHQKSDYCNHVVDGLLVFISFAREAHLLTSSGLVLKRLL